MSIGLVGVIVSLVLGILLGGISGYYGGQVDNVIQRVIEFLRSIPTIPLWMGLAAALPLDWPPITDLLWHHHHPLADRLDRAGARGARALPGAARRGFRHGRRAGRGQRTAHYPALYGALLPQPHHRLDHPGHPGHDPCARPRLSFLGLGLRPPVVSWGVLLQDAQSVRAVLTAPWLLWPGGGGDHCRAGAQLPGRRPARCSRPLLALSSVRRRRQVWTITFYSKSKT